MVIVKMGFRGLTVPAQIERTRLITSSMAGNVTYPTPSPALAAVNAAADALELAYNESRNGDKIKMAAMRLRRKELLALLVLLAGYVQTTSGGDEEKILGSGFGIRTKGVLKPVVAGDVTNLQLSDGEVSGSILINWNKADNAVIYVIEIAQDTDFKDSRFAGITTKTQKLVDELDKGTTYYVRVRALGRERAGNVTQPVSILVR